MLENQIPLFVVLMLLEFQLGKDLDEEALADMLMGLGHELSPFKMVECSQSTEVKDCAHSLDFLYHFIVPKVEVSSEVVEIIEDDNDEREENDDESSISKSYVKQLLDQGWQIVSNLKHGPIKWIKAIIFSKPMKVVVSLPWTILSKISIIKMMKGPIENMFDRGNDKKDDDESGSPISKASTHKPPLSLNWLKLGCSFSRAMAVLRPLASIRSH